MKKATPVPTDLLFHSLITLISCLMTSASLTLKDYGVIPLQPGDVTMIFYATVSNRDPFPQLARLNMTQCCLLLPDSSEDCESMKLYGGLEANLQTRATFNLTMFYITENLFNRKGKCVLRTLSWKSNRRLAHRIVRREVGAEFSVSFDTTLPKANLLNQLQFQLGGSKDGYTLCNTPHLDPERNCQEDNCLMRFSGHRSLFQKESQLCSPSPQCSSEDNQEDLPTQKVSPVTGKCNEISSSETPKLPSELMTSPVENDVVVFGRDEFEFLVPQNNSESIAAFASIIHPVGCVKGKKSLFGCVCDNGWGSVDYNSTSTSNEEYKLCDILTESGKDLERARQHRDNVIVLNIVIGVLCILIVAAIIWAICKRITNRGYTVLKQPPDSQEDTPEDVINEITHRRESSINPKMMLHSSNSQLPPPPTPSQSPSTNKMDSNPSQVSNIPSTQQPPPPPPPSSTSTQVIQASDAAESSDSTHSFITATRATTDFSETESTSAIHTSDSYPDYEGLELSASSSTVTDVDTLISLSHHEKLRTKSEPILFPSNSNKAVAPRRTESEGHSTIYSKLIDDATNNNNIPSPIESDSLEAPNTSTNPCGWTELSEAQKQEEWDKFLKVFATSRLSRRRSLCSTPEEQVRTALKQLSDVQAHKTHSMPALSPSNPFIDSFPTEEQLCYSKSATGISSCDSSGTGGSSKTSIWSSKTSTSDLMSVSCWSTSNDSIGVSLRPTSLQEQDPNENYPQGKLAANFNISLSQQPRQSSSNTNIHPQKIYNLRCGSSSDTDPYAITAKLKEVLRASKSRSVDSLLKKHSGSKVIP